MPPYIRWMSPPDMRAVLAVEDLSFPEPYSEADFCWLLKQRCVTGLVAEIDRSVVGYMIYELMPRSVFLHSFAVHPDFRRIGVGSAFIAKIKQRIRSSDHHRLRQYITADVSERNLDAHLFFKKLGFVAEEILRGYYGENSDLDAYRFRYRLPSKSTA